MHSTGKITLPHALVPHARLAAALAAAFLMTLLLAVALAGEAHAAGLTAASTVQEQVTKYGVWVGDQQVTSANKGNVLGDGHVSYNPKTKTLTLKNARITKAYKGKGGSGVVVNSIMFKLGGTFTIKLVGKNTVSAPSVSGAGYSYGIAPHGSNSAKLKLTGSGSLTVRANKAAYTSCALYCDTATTVQDSVKLNCKSAAAKRISCGIACTKSLTIKGSANVTATGQTGAFYKAPKFSGYTPKVKAGSSSGNIKVNKAKPSTSVYTKYSYANITKVAASPTSKKPGKMTIAKVARGSKRLQVYWKMAKKSTGYEVQISQNKKFPAKQTTKWSAKAKSISGSISISALTAGRTYYVRMRAYNVSGGKTYNGAWTAVKKAKV